MLEKLKNLTRASLVYGVGHILTRLVTFLLLPYYSHKISPAEYGEVSLYFLFLAVVQTFFLYGLDIAYLRYFNLAKEEKDRRTITGTTFWATVLSSSGLALLIIIGSGTLGSLLIAHPVHPEQTGAMIRLCAGILFFDTLSAFPFLLLRSTHRPLRFTAVKLLNVCVNIGLNIWFVGYLEMTTAGVLWANFLASLFTLIVLLPRIIRSGAFTIDRPLFREMLRFGLPNIPTYLFVMVVELADRKIIELYRGIEEAGLYSAGYKLGMFMAVVTAAFRFAWQPFFLSHADDAEARPMYARVLTYYLLVTGVLFLGLVFFIDPLIKHDWPGMGPIIDARYWAGLSVFPIILLAHIFDGVYANLMVGIYLKKQTRKLPLVTGTAAVFTIAACLLLVPTYGMMAAAWITLCAFVLQAGLLYVVVNKVYPVPYEWSRIGKLTLLCVVLYFVAVYVGENSIAVRVLLLVFIPFGLALLKFYDDRERFYIRKLFGRQ
ncbi:lipopolysaccharide biosynthesis protein [bacterium]|nr:lipopolysaccharide biosynthesis protein [bacterium]